MKTIYENIQRMGYILVLLVLFSGISLAANHFTTVWDGQNGQNHMNFVVVSAISDDLPLNANDEIAIFSGSYCVGAKALTQSISLSNSATFLSIPASQKDGVNNGFTENDTIIFKFWDNINQKEMIAKAVTYRNNLSSWSTTGKFSAGATSVVEIVSYTELTQTIVLQSGYNMISTIVTPKDPTVSVVAKPLCDQGYLIKMQDEAGNSFENWGSTGWVNNLGSIQKTEGYQVRVANNCQLQICGRPVTLPMDIQLKAGWNMISFPYSLAVNAKTVVQSLIDQNKLIKVQDEAGHSIENWGIFGDWQNSIGNLMPGKAYKIKLNADATLTILQSYPKSVVILAKSELTDYFTTKIEGNGVDHMNINMVDIREAGIVAGDELAAFDGDLCVGTLKITESHMTNGYASIAASYSTDDKLQNGFKIGDPIQVKVWNPTSGEVSTVQTEVLGGQMTYEKNASVIVKLVSLLAATGLNAFDNMVKIEVYPNPGNGKVTVRFSQLPVNGSRIDILDLSGRKIASRQISDLSEQFNLEQQSAGLYIVKSTIGNYSETQKLIIN
jgi:hypothetical protein